MLTPTYPQPGRRKKGLAGGVVATLLWMISGVGLAQEEAVLKTGQQEYQVYCATLSLIHI